MQTLKGLVGTLVIASIPALDEEEMVLVKLHKVESAGVWVEHQGFTDRMLLRCEIAVSRTTVIVFVPFEGVNFILSSIDSVALSETAFGLSGEET
jgi:hypothetical protein